MKKIVFIILAIVLVVVSGFLVVNKVQKIQEQQYINKTQKEQKEEDRRYTQTVREEREKDPFYPLLPISTPEFEVLQVFDKPYEYIVELKIADKGKAKQAFEKWVQDKNLNISHLKITYQ